MLNKGKCSPNRLAGGRANIPKADLWNNEIDDCKTS